MDAATFRWVLVIIAVAVALAIYFFGQHQARLRKRSAIETVTREEIDSAFIEDEQLRTELDSLNQLLLDDEDDDQVEQIRIMPEREDQTTPFSLPDPEIHVPRELRDRDPGEYISYQLRHEDFRLITGEEASAAVAGTGLTLDEDGYLELREDDRQHFRIASLSPPGRLRELDQLDFSTVGFNCFIDLQDCEDPRAAYEAMLKKIDELVRLLNLKVYKPTQELLTISDVNDAREKLS